MVVPIRSGLHHVSDEEPGIRRTGTTRLRYTDSRTGRAVTDERTLDRIRALAVPPAWTDVWICADPSGHVQATGRDAKGRKQYRYHADFRADRERTKFEDLIAFGEALGGLRQVIDDDLAGTGMGFERVIALIVSLLECTYMRVGNECYASANHTYGLTTLRSRHAEVHGSSVRIKFVGKGGRRTEVELTDPRVSRMIRRCQDLPGQLLFRYEDDDGALHPVTSTDVNDYLRDRTGLDITAKTFRTWTGTLLAAVGFAALSPPKTRRAEQAGVKAVTTTVAETLHNTPAVARASYIHPVVIDSYLDGSLKRRWEHGPSRPAAGLIAEERKLLRVLAPRRRERRAS